MRAKSATADRTPDNYAGRKEHTEDTEEVAALRPVDISLEMLDLRCWILHLCAQTGASRAFRAFYVSSLTMSVVPAELSELLGIALRRSLAASG